MKNATKKIVMTKEGKISRTVSSMVANCRIDEKSNKIYTGYYSGNGRFTSAHSSSPLVESILNAEGYKFAKGNDAPKGGIKGDFLKVSKKALALISEIKQSYFAK